ncbi:MAG: MIP/aquaporin family protein [Pseudomonadota bacterium]
MSPFSPARRIAAEALGTGFLLAGVIGSGIMAETLTGDVALALLANTIATGAILVVLITTLGPISGAHFNPAVTLAMVLRGRIGPVMAAAYLVAQLFGGLAGAGLVHMMFEQSLVQISTNERSGLAQLLSEGVATFGLVFFIFAAVRFKEDAVAWVVGLYIAAAYWFTASTSFANPAVTIARAFTDTFSGIRPEDAPLFIAAQLVGAALAALAAWWWFEKRR